MGRKSDITDAQWADIGRRLLEGESATALGREFGKGESAIRNHFLRAGQKTSTIQQVASRLYEAEQSQKLAQQSLDVLPPAARVSALTLAARMRSVSEKLGAMADVSAGTSYLLASHANNEAEKIDDADPSRSKKRRESAVALQKAANEAAEIPKALLVAASNRDAMKRFGDDTAAPGQGVVTPERLREGARRIAFMLHQAAAAEES